MAFFPGSRRVRAGLRLPLPPLFVVLPALLAALLTALWTGAPPPGVAQQRPSLNLSEFREIRVLRDARETKNHQQVADAGGEYLQKFPRGRYRDEVLLAIAEALQALGKGPAALAAYERLIKNFPDSPFREQALVDSLPLLENGGAGERAAARLAALREHYPGSLVLGKALLWQARRHFENKNYAAAADLLAGESPGVGLSGAETTEWLRLQGWSLLQAGRDGEAWPVFAKYLGREDEMGHKVPVLMRLGEASLAAGAPQQALEYYQQVIGRYPHPDFLNEALYRRAQVFSQLAPQPADGGAGAPVAAQARAYFDAYLATGDARFLAPALKSRAALLAQAGRAGEALADYDRVAALEAGKPVDPEPLQKRAHLMVQLGRGEAAVALLNRALATNPLPPEARAPLVVALANLHYDQGQCGEVLRVLHPLPVFREAPRRRKAFFLRGFCYFRGEQWEKASFDLEGLVTDPQFEAEVWPALMEAYERSGQWARLVNMGETLVASPGVGPSERLLTRMGRGYQKLGQPQMLLSVLERLAALNPQALNTPPIQFQLGLAEEAMGRQSEAEAHFLAVLKIPAGPETPSSPTDDDDRLGALERLQGLLAGKGDHQRLAALNAAAEKRFPENPAAAARIRAWQAAAALAWARTEAQAGNRQSAQQKFEQAEGLYAGLLKSPPRSQGGAGLAREVSAFYLAWAETAGETDPPGAAAARYRRALEVLPAEAWREKQGIAGKLDSVHLAEGNFAARAELFETLLPQIPDPPARETLRTHLVGIYLEWGKKEMAGKAHPKAIAAYRKGMAHLRPEEGQLRYAFTAGLGEVYLATGDYSPLTIDYERILPEIKEAGLRAEVTRFLGRVYLAWGKQAEKEKNAKSIRLRALRALKYLPDTDWRDRLAATNLLVALLDQQKKTAQAVQLLEKVIPALPPGEPRQRQALLLSARYLTLPQKNAAAWKWLAAADLGGNDPLSLEAGYRMAGLELKARKITAAAKRLEELVARGLEQSLWLVPIHYRVAAAYHAMENLGKALPHYQQVASVRSRELRKTYPTLIKQAGQQVKAIQAYLSLRGGGKTKIAIPRVNP